MLQTLLTYIRERKLISAGDRVAVAVSGGADSVALLRALLELREELGIILSVVHFNHRIRGSEGDADAEFVASLAHELKLPIQQSSGDVPLFAKKWKLSMEAAARRMRYEMFRTVLAEGRADKIATAHTRDDQAETVLLRTLRGAGTRGIGGIHPVLSLEHGTIIRPMLETSRAEVEAYLKSLGQTWREDSTNAETVYTRNRVRHELLPLLERDYNPNLRQVLSEAAEVARDEEDYWKALVDNLAEGRIESREGVTSVRFGGAESDSVAVQRRLLRRAAESAGIQLDFHHGEQILALLAKPKGAQVELPNGWRASRTAQDTIELRGNASEPMGYEYSVSVPGEVLVSPVRTLVRLTIVRGDESRQLYNPASLVDGRKLDTPVILRSWRPGDRIKPLHRGSEEKLKTLFQQGKVPAVVRPLWPVIVCGDRLVWTRKFGVAAEFAAPEGNDAVLIEELPQ